MCSSAQGSVIVDLKGEIAFASTFFCELVQVDANQAAGRPFFDFVFPEDVGSAKIQIQASTSADAPAFVLKLRRADGTGIWAAVQGQPLQRVSGELYGISAIIASIVGPVADQELEAAHSQRGAEVVTEEP